LVKVHDSQLNQGKFDLHQLSRQNMQRHLFILTGASRGMGLAMAEQLLAQQNHLLCISRHANPSLASVAEQRNCPLAQWTLDLS
jgi:NAD(P)-dependent dehydrogenase (short-subunit alcohol dehydrogenase family)